MKKLIYCFRVWILGITIISTPVEDMTGLSIFLEIQKQMLRLIIEEFLNQCRQWMLISTINCYELSIVMRNTSFSGRLGYGRQPWTLCLTEAFCSTLRCLPVWAQGVNFEAQLFFYELNPIYTGNWCQWSPWSWIVWLNLCEPYNKIAEKNQLWFFTIPYI